MAPVEELALLEFDRSNKGASKQRRDQINAEIATMRDLLPLPESSRQRLSQLQIMSLTCVYIRKCNVLQKLFRCRSQETQLPDSLDFFQALTGFLLVTTREGKLLYISENVTDYLGHSMVDMKTQGDSLYDIVDKRDHASVQSQLLHGGSQLDSEVGMDISFFCRMNMSRTLKRQSGFGDVKVMHICGHFLPMNASDPGGPSDGQSVFMAVCSPVITPDIKENLVQNNTMVFKSVHKLDMTIMEVTRNGEYHLGCTSEELINKSWYSMLYPEDIHEAKEKHVQLIRSNHEIGCMLTVRMLRMDGTHFWVNVVMHVRQASLTQNEEPLIVCVNQVIDAHEAYQIKVQSHMFSMYPNRTHEIWGNHVPTMSPSNQDHLGGQWIQQSGSASVPLPGYPANIPSYMTHSVHPDMFSAGCSAMIGSSIASKPAVAYPLSSQGSFVQLDQLKAMLKRKIQGPQSTVSCKPSKVAKMNWDMDRTSGGSTFTEIDHDMPHMEHYSQMSMSSHADCQNQMVQVLQPENYRIGFMTASKMSLKQLSCRGMPKSSSIISEQVVPDLSVPESYLTPDPSPVSSPQPSLSLVKTEMVDPEEKITQGKTTANILQALEKLAALPQASIPHQVAQRRKELPVFDAFDIDNFFETLKPTELQAKVSLKMEDQLQSSVKMELLEDQTQAENIPNFAALKDERSTPGIHYESPILVVPSMMNDSPRPHVQSPVHQSYIPLAPDAQAGLSFLGSNGESQTVQYDLHSGVYKKDMLVSSPESTTSQESIDDLLSYFSDDSADMSPVHLDERSSGTEVSSKDDLIDVDFENAYCKSFYTKKVEHNTPLSVGIQEAPEEFSPQSSSSSLVGEDDLIVGSPTFALDMALSVLDAQSQMSIIHNSDTKDQDVFGLSDELKLDYIINSWAPSESSLDMMKHSQ